ncbi:hypothetical protein MKX03_008209 [Papaver bracteatum]|nr:hypothetical protein MKX03_008209 [Papaver bracteatum]
MKPKPRSTFVNRQRAKEIATDAVNERLNAVAPKKNRSSTTEPSPAFINGTMGKETMTDGVDDRLDAVTRKRQRTSTTVPWSASFISTDAVDERLEPVTLKRHRSTTAPCSLVNGQWEKEIMTDAVDVRISAVALEKQRSSTTNQRSAYINGGRANEIVTDPEDERMEDERITDVTDTFVAWSDIQDEDADMLDADENGGMQLEDDHATDTHNESNSEDYTGTNPGITCRPLGDMLDADENGDMQLEDDHATDTHNESNSEDYTCTNPGITCRPLGDILDADENGDMQLEDDHAPDTHNESNSEDYTGTNPGIICRPLGDMLDADENGDMQLEDDHATDTHNESNSEDYTGINPGITCRRLGSRQQIIFDKYGRYCDVGSEQFANAIGKIVRARCPPAIDDWRIVPEIMKEDIWKNLVAEYVIPQVYKPNILSRARISWKSWKRLFRKLYDMEKESPTGEVNRAVVFVETHVTKTLNNPESSSISDVKIRKIKELVDANPNGQKDIDNDAVALICGRDSRGHVRGMGGGLSRTTMRASAPIIETLRKVQEENKSMQSEIHLLKTQHGTRMQDVVSTSSNQSALQGPDESNVPASSCFMKNFKGRTIALGRFNTVDPAMEHVYSIIVEEIFDRDAELFDKVGKLGDIVIGGVINWPKACTKPASLCFVKNFKGRTIALGSYNSVDPPMEHVCSVKVEEIFDEESELFDEDGKLGDIMIGDVINWPKACVQSY